MGYLPMARHGGTDLTPPPHPLRWVPGGTAPATGGGTNNQNDLCWVLTKVKPARGPERTVLALYRAKKGGDYFDLEDVRMIDADIRVIDMKATDHKRVNSDVQTILKALPQAEQDAIKPQNN